MYNVTPLTQLEGGDGGAALRAMMEERGVTVAALVKITGLSRRTVQNLRAGKSATYATWRAVARALRCQVDDIAG